MLTIKTEKGIGRVPDFIGLGAQKAGTSWIYSCLYEHPQICMPIKEIHFFSRQRNWTKGYDWYESVFDACSPSQKTGEFSTSYLAEHGVAERIHQRYPRVKLIASLRNPLDRAYSNYVNDVKAGIVQRNIPFEAAVKTHPEYLEQGRYTSQLNQYLHYFARDQLLLLVYEDSLTDPTAFIQRIYRFLGVAPEFIPSMIHTKINVSTIPRYVWLEKSLLTISGFLHNKGFHHLWWLAKKLGITQFIRKANAISEQTALSAQSLWREAAYKNLEAEIRGVETLLGRELREWRL